ncbi:MAG: hypothetical protein EOP19_19805 [Hyphomicrobiales bacterium]|nr:MAG: hypothetical protein EOP19_19805 [Hyphomicrobiales bacterium]
MRVSSSSITLAAVAAALVAGLSACASDGASAGGPSRYTQEMDRLTASCTARGGMLQPTGAVSGEPARDNACVIRGNTGRLD